MVCCLEQGFMVCTTAEAGIAAAGPAAALPGVAATASWCSMMVEQVQTAKRSRLYVS